MRRRSFVQLIFGGCAAAGCAVVAVAMPRTDRKAVLPVSERHQTVGLLKPVDGSFTYNDAWQRHTPWHKCRWTECRWTGGMVTDINGTPISAPSGEMTL